jgi:hypothetical protein
VHPTFFQTPMIDAVSANPAALRVMSNFKGVWRLAPIETVVDGTIGGIERRCAHVIIPRSLRPVALAPGLLGPLIARFGFRGNAIADATTLATSAAATDQPPAAEPAIPAPQTHAETSPTAREVRPHPLAYLRLCPRIRGSSRRRLGRPRLHLRRFARAARPASTTACAPTAGEPPARARTLACAPSAGLALRRRARPGEAIRARR